MWRYITLYYTPTLLCARITHFQPCTITQSSERISGQKLSISYLPGYWVFARILRFGPLPVLRRIENDQWASGVFNQRIASDYYIVTSYLNAFNLLNYNDICLCNSLSTKCISNTMVILMISDTSCHNMEPSWISMTGLSRTYFIIDKIWQIQSRYVINTTLPGVFSIRPVFGLGAVFALGLRPRANTGHLSQIPGRILKKPGNIVYVSISNEPLVAIWRDRELYLLCISKNTIHWINGGKWDKFWVIVSISNEPLVTIWRDNHSELIAFATIEPVNCIFRNTQQIILE